MTAPAHAPAARQPVRAATAAVVGTTIEWYDFYIYATAAALVFGKVFFPTADPFISTMASFGTFAAGFLARPLGGVLDIYELLPAFIIALIVNVSVSLATGGAEKEVVSEYESIRS